MKKNELSNRITVYLICALLFGFSAAFFLTPKKEFSESENRILASWPAFSFESLTSGRYTEGIKDYLSDHFPGRDELLRMINSTERVSGRKEINGVYLCDDRLINAYKEHQNTEKDITQFSRLAQNVKDARVSLALVPTAVSIYNEKLPDNAPDKRTGAERFFINEVYSAVPAEVDKIDLYGALSAAREAASAEDSDVELYYRTDHHWTTYGAYTGYREICNSLGLDPVALEEYTADTVTATFYGSIFSKLNDDYVKPDEIVSYSLPSWQLKVEYADTGAVTGSPYDPAYLEKRDKYSYFLSNQHGLITITNEAVPEEAGGMALVKDSYANCLVPYFAAHYRTLYIFDTRYHKGGVSKFINEHEDIKEVLILYNTGTIDSDSGIGGVY